MTREEALQAIKEKIAYYESDKRLKGAIETLIPELKESEDERIRKIITDSVFYQYGAGVEYEDVLDYLDKPEKQKEQKPSHKFNVGDTIHCKYDDREFTIKSVDLTNMVYKYTKEGCGNDIDYADEDFELVEQKPVKWSEEDEANLDYLIDYCNSQENGQHPILMTSVARKISLWLYRLKSGEITIKRQANDVWSNDDEERFDSVCSVLRSKLDEGNWKPLIDLLLRLKTAYCYQRAYNEKDEKTIHLACEFIRHHATKNDSIGGIDCSELVKRLKSLRPQPKQEWSDEDEQKYQSIRAILLEDTTKKIGKRTYGDVLEWYESKGKGRFTLSKIK